MAHRPNALWTSLVAHLPGHERTGALRTAASNLQPHDKNAGQIASLLRESSDAQARRIFRERLVDLLESGDVNGLLAAGEADPDLRKEVLDISIARLSGVALKLQQEPGKAIALSMRDVIALTPVQGIPSDLDASSSAKLAFPLLHYITTSVSPFLDQASTVQLLNAAIILVGASSRSVQVAGRNLVARLATFDSIGKTELRTIWRCLETLISSKADTYFHDMAYFLWMRIAITKPVTLRPWFSDEYWILLREGLRHGDGERRKQSLMILRRSVGVVLEEESLKSAVCSESASSQETSTIIDQYERYCTVFETVLLGRYLNQVLACEDDLQLLSSPQAIVKPDWVYTLLAASLSPKIQESNRKFIGNWIMRSGFQPDSRGAFVDFFRTAFLPWATQGSLYTTTLKKQDGRLRCVHGQRVADYVRELLVRNANDSELSSQLIDAVLGTLTSRKTGNFAYASVYFLDGLARAYEHEKQLRLSRKQLEALVDLSASAALPEVARDFVYIRCIEMCGDSSFRDTVAFGSPTVVEAISRWNGLTAQLRGERPASMPHDKFEPITAWESVPSNRDIMEMKAHEKCQACRTLLAKYGGSNDEAIVSTLEDIWSDLEYLEYPKRLLLELPGLLLQPGLVKSALQVADNGKLRLLLPDLLRRLQKLSSNRAYMLAPLVLGVREMVLAEPSFAELMDLGGFIETYAMRLPDVTVDLQLEDATAHLLQDVAPHFQGFGYEYYFGDRDTLGVAALLDLVSRLGDPNRAVVQSLFDALLQRWAKQKGHIASVSPWKRTLQMQLLLLCSEQVLPLLSLEQVRSTLQDLHHILSIEPLPRYRYLLSWIIARIYLRTDELRSHMLAELRSPDHHSNPKYLASLMKLGVMLVKSEGGDAEFASGLATSFVPLAASSKVVIRHEAQWQVPQLMDHARARGWAAIIDDAAFGALDEYIRNLPRFDEPPLERQLDRFDPVQDHTMTNLVEGLWYGLDNTEVPLCGQADFVKLYEAETVVGVALAASCIPIGDAITGPRTQPNGDNTDPVIAVASSNAALAPSKAGEPRALQTKGSAYLASGLEAFDEQQVRRNELIVIASLVDNPYNLGGLSRVSEIFGASEMHLQNQNVTSNRDFTNVSVSSHQHLPIHQLSARSVSEYLADKKRDGWTIVGIEQTDRSLVLGSEECKLPEKIVLVIGSEKEGIPALVLGECDMLVEIPQQGVTRSLNVQTAAAIVLFEYARQHRTASS